MSDEAPQLYGLKIEPARNASGQTSSQLINSTLGVEKDDEHQVHELARRLTGMSRASATHEHHETSDPTLDPFSYKFNHKTWPQNLIGLGASQQGEYPRRNASASFRQSSAYGFGSSPDYQKDFMNVVLEGSAYIQKIPGRGQTKIDMFRIVMDW
jgi:hypothetical protein